MWAIVRGLPCRTGLGREFTRPPPKLRGISVVFGHAVLFGVPVFEVRLLEDLQILQLRMKLEIEPSLLRP